MTPAAAIEAQDLDKSFRIPHHQIFSIKERVLHPFRRTEYDELRVLNRISFQVAEGEFFGIVGRNGSGKSTLLKCLAGIYRADGGSIRIAGQLAPFIELGVGFNPDLTARENVVINAVMMGLTPREARRRFDDVIAFAELEDFIELKLKNYSSGMQVRLAFAIMVQSDADVLLIDEVLAVGDAAFQQKCLDAFYRLRKEGKTIVLVTHDMNTVERFCHRAMLLEDGDIRMVGAPPEVGRLYLETSFQAGERPAVEEDPASQVAPEPGSPAHITRVWVTDEEGRAAGSVAHGSRVWVHAELEARERIERPTVNLWLENEEGMRLFGASSERPGTSEAAFEAGEQVRMTVEMETPFGAGHYYLGCSATQGSAGEEIIARWPRAADLVIFGGEDVYGLVAVRHEVALERELNRAAQ